MIIALALFAALITAQPLVDADVLEPSVQNEVDHALSRAPTNDVPATAASQDARLITGRGRSKPLPFHGRLPQGRPSISPSLRSTTPRPASS